MFTLIIFFPLLSFFMLLLFGRKLGIEGSNLFSCIMMFCATSLSITLFYDLIQTNSVTFIYYWTWVSFILLNNNLSFFVDTMSASMILVVNLVSFLVHVYSVSYMRGDPHTPRFMGYLSMFTFFMLLLVAAQNYLQLFIGWEGVGLCSYLLINFWYGRIQANKAAIKAMLVNRIGDAALVAAIILIWLNYGSINFLTVLPVINVKTTAIIPLLLLIGAVGKSAQIGLHTWLPDAMEGPTPVSALIHAATMVTAGVYLIIRSSVLFENSPAILIITVVIGSITALFAATIGLAQNDIKKIIAYSTCSQLGFMVLSCGISYYSLALFHLVNHAFFKALLFLSAGSIIHSLLDEQDVRKMGSVIMVQPLSYFFVLVGSLALAGFPFLSGYYSKDLLLELSSKEYFVIFGCWMGLSATLLTAFYSFKLISRTFLLFQNTSRIQWLKSHEGDWFLLIPLVLLAIGSIFSGYLLNDSILNFVIHPIVSFNIKMLPLILSLLGGSLGILLFIITKKTWKLFFVLKIRLVYQFLSSAWDFDKIFNKFIIAPTLRFGYIISFKNFDTGILEKLGPIGVSNYGIKISKKISEVQSGYLFNYAILIILFSSLFILFS
uniref:NADH dehydrogenase subunit 5 n=1 Tax=Catostylus townsendi TaxID=2053110 RepID=UPI001FA7E3B5|nr:NADH dehydrogenase subunit 5 [Catostylus townsendi]UNB15554.1 NADH dehydrogenase subunit 5 [Catostylus townsendi]